MNYENVVLDDISFDVYMGYEYLILLPPVFNSAKYKEIDDSKPPELEPSIALVYQFKLAIEPNRFMYKFIGAKVR